MRATNGPSLVDRFTTVTTAVVGDVLLDAWMGGAANRLAPEGPVPVVTLSTTTYAPGGAGNTAANLAALGARVHLLSVVGDDDSGRVLRSALAERGVSSEELITSADRRTTVKHRLVAGSQVLARYDDEDGTPLAASAEQALIDKIRQVGPAADTLIVCDYAAGVCTDRVRAAVTEVCGDGGPTLIVDARHPGRWTACRPLAVLPNFAEVLELLGEDGEGERIAFLTTRSRRLLERTRAEYVVTTLDGAGTLLHQRRGHLHRTYATPAPDQRSAGAGDTYTATFALGLAVGAGPEVAADLAQAAASVVVRREGTALCSRHDLARALSVTASPALSTEQLGARITACRNSGGRVVFTNGCFDVLHRGHIAYLQQAAALGDVLVVAVNSDESVARLKGPDRPINRVEDRVAVLGALGCVDYVTVFDEDNPERLLRMVRPDVYVKGGDYSPLMLSEAPLVEELGGEVRIVDYVADRSTTSLVERIRAGGPAGDE